MGRAVGVSIFAVAADDRVIRDDRGKLIDRGTGPCGNEAKI